MYHVKPQIIEHHICSLYKHAEILINMYGRYINEKKFSGFQHQKLKNKQISSKIFIHNSPPNPEKSVWPQQNIDVPPGTLDGRGRRPRSPGGVVALGSGSDNSELSERGELAPGKTGAPPNTTSPRAGGAKAVLAPKPLRDEQLAPKSSNVIRDVDGGGVSLKLVLIGAPEPENMVQLEKLVSLAGTFKLSIIGSLKRDVTTVGFLDDKFRSRV